MRRRMIVSLALALLALSGCAPQPATTHIEQSAAPAPVYALVLKDTKNQYMHRMGEGFAAACAELSVTARIEGPATSSASEQAAIIEALIAQGVSAIAVAANEKDALDPSLGAALRAGIQVISLDAQVNVNSRKVHIQQADPEKIGRVLIQAAHKMISEQGQIAILSTTEAMPNQAVWVHWMLKELEEYPVKYKDMQLAGIAYGQDEYEASAQATRELLARFPELSVIIAPTTVGLLAAARVIEQARSDVLVTGLGLPSEMENYILKGICPWMYLWNPVDIGYLSAYALDALRTGAITGAQGETFAVGNIGEKVITRSEDGGSEIVLGNPLKFDSDNIALWLDTL